MTDGFYPGSSTPIGQRPEPREPIDWGRPIIYNVGGVATEFYTVGQVAAALGRSATTMRKWERNGWLPKAAFRTPSVVRQKARRLYTRAQLEAIVRVAFEEGLMEVTVDQLGRPHPKVAVADTKFVQRVSEALKRVG